jgi:hypothetical protein
MEESKKSVRAYFITAWSEPSEEILGDARIKYYCCGKEICPKTKKEHWHIYLRLHSPCRFTGLKKILQDDKIKIFEPRNLEEDGEPSTWDESKMISYCMKCGNFIEHGERKWAKGKVEKKPTKQLGMTKETEKIFWDKIHAELIADPQFWTDYGVEWGYEIGHFDPI